MLSHVIQHEIVFQKEAKIKSSIEKYKNGTMNEKEFGKVLEDTMNLKPRNMELFTTYETCTKRFSENIIRALTRFMIEETYKNRSELYDYFGKITDENASKVYGLIKKQEVHLIKFEKIDRERKQKNKRLSNPKILPWKKTKMLHSNTAHHNSTTTALLRHPIASQHDSSTHN